LRITYVNIPAGGCPKVKSISSIICLGIVNPSVTTIKVYSTNTHIMNRRLVDGIVISSLPDTDEIFGMIASQSVTLSI